MERRDKISYYLDLAEAVAQRSTCLRRHFGAVIVRMMRLYQPVTAVHRGAEKTVLI